MQGTQAAARMVSARVRSGGNEAIGAMHSTGETPMLERRSFIGSIAALGAWCLPGRKPAKTHDVGIIFTPHTKLGPVIMLMADIHLQSQAEVMQIGKCMGRFNAEPLHGYPAGSLMAIAASADDGHGKVLFRVGEDWYVNGKPVYGTRSLPKGIGPP